VNDPARVLLSTVFKPFCVEDEFNAPGNLIEHSLVHRSFTRRQGMFTVDQQCVTFPLHLIAHNLAAPVTVLEYPSLDEFASALDAGWDVVGITCTASTLNKARRMCEVVRDRAPGAQTVIGGGGSLAVGEVAEPFSDHVCRGEGAAFLRDLLGEPEAPLTFPVVPTVHRPNRLLGLPAHDPNFAVAVGLGCSRGCEFCATSHQFGGRYLPIFESGAELFAFMRSVDEHERRHGRRHRSIGFLVFDENFLLNRDLVEEFRLLNREQLLTGTQYLCFVFADARALAGYSVEELLEIGVDSVWVGIESPSASDLAKLKGVDPRALVTELSEHGIKVFASLMAGLEEHSEALIREDMEYALGVPATAFQYAPVDPLPGTPYYARLAEAGRIPDRDLSYFSMSHYNLSHDSLDEETVLGLIEEFLDRDYEQHGPLVYRFLKGRWDGYRRLREHESRYVRVRAEGFGADVLRGFPVMLLGEVFAPTEATRSAFSGLRREVGRHFPRLSVVADLLRRRWRLRDGGIYLASSPPGLRTLARWALSAWVVRSDPRSGLLSLLTDGRAAVDRARHGTVPWKQPETVRTEYGPSTTARR